MVDRIAFGWLARSFLDRVGETPVMVGWTPMFGEWRRFRKRFSDKIVCIDKSAWDWTVQPWLIDALFDVINELAIDAAPWLRRLFVVRFKQLFRDAVFQFRDGQQVTQTGTGVMKSGCYLTIILNSIAQLLLHAVACFQMGVDPCETVPCCMGDDTVQDLGDLDIEGYIRHLERLGAKAKFSGIKSFVDFAGFKISSESCIPAYFAKHLYKLEYASDLSGFLENMQLLYAHSPSALRMWREVAKKTDATAVITDRRHNSLLF